MSDKLDRIMNQVAARNDGRPEGFSLWLDGSGNWQLNLKSASGGFSVHVGGTPEAAISHAEHEARFLQPPPKRRSIL